MRKTLFISALFILLIGAIGGFYMYQTLTMETKVFEKKTFEQIHHISINTVTIDTTIDVSKDAAVHVELIGNKKQKNAPQIVTSTRNNQLTIDVQEIQKSKWINARLIPGANKLKITVPEQIMQTIESKSTSGHLTIENVKAEHFLMKSDVGNIRFKHTEGAYTIKSITGNIQLEQDEIAHPLSITSDSGDIQIQTKQKPHDARLTAKTLSGNASIYDEKLNSKIFGEGQTKIDLFTTSGDISVNVQ